MVSDKQVRKLMKLLNDKNTLAAAALSAGLDEKTARKYRALGKLPSEVKPQHNWRTRKDPFAEVWDEVESQLSENPGLEAKTLFSELQRKYPGRFSDGQLRTLQRRVKIWRGLHGPQREVFFAQRREPGKESQSDFVRLSSLNITIQGQAFRHMLYHFVLPYSNWEAGSICFSESFESLSEGLQNALWKLGGVPISHQTDRLSTAVQKTSHPDEFTRRYKGLLDHYCLQGRKINVKSPNENGDVEQRHHRFKRALDQALMLRGSRDFADQKEYERFLEKLFEQLNAGRRERLQEELKVLGSLPMRRMESYKRLWAKVGVGSTISVERNTYSVKSSLIGERVEVRLYAERLEVWYGQRCVERMPRLLGRGKHRINYRHVVKWLARKPGAFENYRYREDMFPTSRFRLAYDELASRHALSKAGKQYLKILELAALENEQLVDECLRSLIDDETPITFDSVQSLLERIGTPRKVTDVEIAGVDLDVYDGLLSNEEALTC